MTVSTGIITTVAGNGGMSYSGDNGPATSAALQYPTSTTLDSSGISLVHTNFIVSFIVTHYLGNIYICDAFNQRIRKVTVSTGIITTYAGTGSTGFSGDGGAATSAKLYNPFYIALDSAGNLYIGDRLNNRIRKVTVSTGIITTVAGTGNDGYSGDNGQATSATFNIPNGIVLDSIGTYVDSFTSYHFLYLLFYFLSSR